MDIITRLMTQDANNNETQRLYDNNILIRSSSKSSSNGTIMQSASPSPVSTTHVETVAQPQHIHNSSSSATIPPTNQTKRKRTLYLHIGPLKTGTTSLQTAMGGPIIKNGAQLDGIALRPLKVITVEKCFETRDFLEECKSIIQTFFDEQDADTVFLSHEVLGVKLMDEDYWSMLMSVLEDNWDVRIVLGYRRYYEWKISMANQIFKLHWRNTGPIEDLLSVQHLFQSEKFEDQVPRKFFQFYRNHGGGVFGVINLHDTNHTQNHIAERAFCQIVENAPNLCTATRQYVERNARRQHKLQGNQSAGMACRSIALAALHAGVVPPKDDFAEHVKQLYHYIKKRVSAMGHNCDDDYDLQTKLPRVCLPSFQKEAILNRTLADEASALPEFFQSPAGETALREEFAKADRKGKFCSVDHAAVIADDQWKEILAGFDPEESYYKKKPAIMRERKRQRKRKDAEAVKKETTTTTTTKKATA